MFFFKKKYNFFLDAASLYIFVPDTWIFRVKQASGHVKNKPEMKVSKN